MSKSKSQKRDFVIDEEIQTLLPVLTPEERSQLRANLLSGRRHVDPLVILVVGEMGTERLLGDGHNRLEICDEEDIPYTTRDVDVPDRDAALQWVIDNQLGKRNLTDERRAYYIGKEYLLLKKGHGDPKRFNFDDEKKNDTVIDSAASCQSGNLGEKVAETVAKKHGVSSRTVHRDAEFAAGVDAAPADEQETILSGASGKTKKQVASAAILCSRCKRVGAVKDCPQCAELRKAKPAGKKKKSSLSPKEVFEKGRKKALEALGVLVRALDDMNIQATLRIQMEAIKKGIVNAKLKP